MKLNSKFDKLNELIDKAIEMGMEVQIVSSKEGVVSITNSKKTIYFFGSSLPLNNVVATKLTKYKDVTKKVLSRIGINTPKGILVSTVAEVENAIESKEIKFPLVVKPNDSALGIDVSANINESKELMDIVRDGLSKHPNLIVEEYFEGEDHRVLVIDGRIIAVCMRKKPVVVGDGDLTLRALIEKYNEGREKPLKVDEEVKRNLSKQKVTLESVVKPGKEIVLRENSNIATGGMVIDMTDEISNFFKDVALKAIKELGLRIGGVDIITKDITKENSDYIITEVNGLPSYDIHQTPHKGKSIDARDDILNACFRDIY